MASLSAEDDVRRGAVVAGQAPARESRKRRRPRPASNGRHEEPALVGRGGQPLDEPRVRSVAVTAVKIARGGPEERVLLAVSGSR